MKRLSEPATRSRCVRALPVRWVSLTRSASSCHSSLTSSTASSTTSSESVGKGRSSPSRRKNRSDASSLPSARTIAGKAGAVSIRRLRRDVWRNDARAARCMERPFQMATAAATSQAASSKPISAVFRLSPNIFVPSGNKLTPLRCNESGRDATKKARANGPSS